MSQVVPHKKHANPGAADAAADDFARRLVEEIGQGVAHLPAWSQDMERVLAETLRTKPSAARLVQWTAMDPSLVVAVMSAARMALFANSAGSQNDLQGALLALGPERLRALLFACGLLRLREAPRLQAWRRELQSLVAGNVRVSALCQLLAARTGVMGADDALGMGLLHNIGKYWLYARLPGAGAWQDEPRTRLGLLSRWHTRVAQAALASWNLPDWLGRAVAGQDELGGATRGADAAELLAAAVVAARTAQVPGGTARHLADFSRLGLDEADWRELFAQLPSAAARVQALFNS